MDSTQTLRLPGLLYRLERLNDPFRQVWRITHDITSGKTPVSDRKLLAYIHRMRTLCHAYPWLEDILPNLCMHGIRRERMPLENILELIDILSNERKHQNVRDALAVLAKHGTYLDQKQVNTWVENGMHGHDGYKFPALMLLVGDQRYFRGTTTAQLCYYLELSATRYAGDHGVFRFFAMLVLRMQHIRPSARIYPRCAEVLTEALWQVGRFDGFFFQHLLDWIAKLPPAGRIAIGKEYRKHLDQYFAELVRLRKARSAFAPATS